MIKNLMISCKSGQTRGYYFILSYDLFLYSYIGKSLGSGFFGLLFDCTPLINDACGPESYILPRWRLNAKASL